ncbi:hypothetical protein D3C86_2262030 [compost metagenome]
MALGFGFSAVSDRINKHLIVLSKSLIFIAKAMSELIARWEPKNEEELDTSD